MYCPALKYIPPLVVAKYSSLYATLVLIYTQHYIDIAYRLPHLDVFFTRVCQALQIMDIVIH